MRLSQKVAIVTGAGSGIGRGIAERFAKEGAKVCAADWNLETAAETVALIKQEKGSVFAHKVDVSNWDQVKEMIEQTLKHFGRIDILVNNAGVYLPHDAVSATEEEWTKTIGVDLKGVWYGSKAVLPHFLQKGRGRIINITSIAGLYGFANSALYCAAKGGVIALTRQMAVEYATGGIRINAIAPGFIRTKMTQPFVENKEFFEAFLKMIPAGRIGEPEDIANFALYLASDESDFMTGQVLIVDGGQTAQ